MPFGRKQELNPCRKESSKFLACHEAAATFATGAT
jgi:hypothetical protein